MVDALKKPPFAARLTIDALALFGASHLLHLVLRWAVHHGC